MKRNIIFAIFILFTNINAIAQTDSTERPYVRTGFVIIQSTKDYAVAKATAVSASKRLNSKLDLRGLKPNKKNGLTFSAADCVNEGGYPCYIARGRYDAGQYVSIEWSDAYDGFAKGYYIVIAASGSKADTDGALAKAKKIYKDAYNKTTEVYVGCMH